MYALRPAKAEDFALVQRIHHESMRVHVEKVWGWDAAVQAQFVKDWFAPEKLQIIQVGGEDVGLLTVEPWPDMLFLSAISLLPSHQGKGVGAQVVADVCAEGRKRGMPVHLQVLKVNPAKRLYDRLGFAVVGETDTHWQMTWRPA